MTKCNNLQQRAQHATFLFGVLISLSACNPFRYLAPDSTDIQTRHQARPGELEELHPLYCYDTLGDPQCYTHPLKEQDARIKGYYGPHPTHMDPYYDKGRMRQAAVETKKHHHTHSNPFCAGRK